MSEADGSPTERFDPLTLLTPRRRITGISAILLPFSPSGSIDWEAFEGHVARTAAAGLVPAVNMDTGYVNLLDDAAKSAVLTRTKRLSRSRRRDSRRYGQAQRSLVSAEYSEFLKHGAAQITWTKVEKWRAWAELSEGAYVLRSNVSDWTDQELWQAYIQLTEAEAAFRIQKSDLSLRPVWHQKEDRVLAHILVCFLAYVLWKFLGQLCLKAGLGDEPRRVLQELSELCTVDVVLATKAGQELRTRCITQPTARQKILLDHLGRELPKNRRHTQTS